MFKLFYVETVYFLALSSQNILALIWSTLEGWKTESTLESPSGFELRTTELEIQCRKFYFQIKGPVPQFPSP